MDKNRSLPGGPIIPAVLLGVLIGALGATQFRGHNSTGALQKAYRAPQLQQLPDTVGKPLVVEAYIDAKGRIWDYKVLSNAGESNTLSSNIKNLLIFSVFRPATLMGQPTTGTATLVFSTRGLATDLSSMQRE